MKFRKILLFILLISLLSSCSSFLSPSEESSIDQSGEMSEGMVPSYSNEEQDISTFNIRDSLMVRMGACRVPDRGSIPRRGDFF